MAKHVRVCACAAVVRYIKIKLLFISICLTAVHERIDREMRVDSSRKIVYADNMNQELNINLKIRIVGYCQEII